MKLITRDTDYAIRAICFIARGDKKITSVGDLVRALKIPRPFLRKILQRLNNAKLLKSYRGQGGGFSLAVPLDKIYLLGLIRIFQGQFKLNECFFKKRSCPDIPTCGLKKKIDKIEKQVIKGLDAINISCLLEQEGKYAQKEDY